MKKAGLKLSKLPFWGKLFFSFLILVIFVIISLTAVLLTSFSKSTNELCNRFFNTLLQQSNYSITYVNDIAQRLSSTLAYNREVISFLNMTERDNQQTAITHRTVNDIVRPLSYVNGIYLYNKKLDLLLCTKTGIQSSPHEFYDRAIEAKLKQLEEGASFEFVPFAHDVSYANTTVSVYSYIVPNHTAEDVLSSAMIVNINMDLLMESLQEINADSEYVNFFILDSNGAFLISPPFSSVQKASELQTLGAQAISSGKSSGNFFKTIDDTKYLLSYTNMNSNGWYLFGMTPYSKILGDVTASAIGSLLFIFVLFGICIFAALHLAQRLNRPIQAISHMVHGQQSTPLECEALKADEFRSIATAFKNIREKNDELSQYKSETTPIVRQEFLESLICGTGIFSPEKSQLLLHSTEFHYLITEPLCMCLLSIDNYTNFAQKNNPHEQGAIRYAIINVATELLGESFRCEMVPHHADKFVIVLGIPGNTAGSSVNLILEAILNQITTFFQTHLQFSLTAAYSSIFRGVGYFPAIYENLEELLLLRVHHGYGKILNPHMAEEFFLEEFQVSATAENLLVRSITNYNPAQAVVHFDAIAKELFQYGYNDIMPYLMHLSYRILNTAKEVDSSVKTQIAEEYKTVSAQLAQCELQDDFYRCFVSYLKNICSILAAQKSITENQSSNVLVQRLIKIIEEKYSQPELCLSSIADELGLSAHYIGQVFRSEKKCSISKYLFDLRMEKIAQELRETDRSFADILERVGLNSDQKNYIYTCFKKHFGVTVKNYRAQYNATKFM